MPAEEPVRNDGGAASVDWPAAFLFFAGLPTNERSYRAVANEFGANVRTVERHGREEHWRERARELDREAERQAANRLRDERAAKLVDVERLVDASFVAYATLLRGGDVRMTPADLGRLHQLRNTLWAEQPESTDDPVAPRPTADERWEHRRQVLRALHEAGVLDRLLALDAPPSEAERPDRAGER